MRVDGSTTSARMVDSVQAPSRDGSCLSNAARGDSLIPADRGDIVAAMLYNVDAAATLRGYYSKSDAVRFVAANNAYEDIVIPHGSSQR